MMEDNIDLLLGRTSKQPLLDVSKYLRNSVVLVTGAGGSIGSELCLQLIALHPKTILLVDKDEFSLYTIDRRLRESHNAVNIVPILASVLHKDRMESLIKTFQPEYVFHVAAYKHVPLVERNPCSGIRNNTLGTSVLAKLCSDSSVKKFVFVSTDKAVNPTNIMGASKRLAEYATLCYDERFSVVRFGNVLWSSGSVLPLFYKQLLENKVVTITHKDVTRYFMSITEAVMLVMQSTFIEGRIKVLNMGEQVRIEELANRLAHCLNIENYNIKYIGLRSGEKLYEELTLGEHLQDTIHPDIQIAEEPQLSETTIQNYLTKLSTMCDSNDIPSIRILLQEIVPGYLAACGIVDELWIEEQFLSLKQSQKLGDCYEHTTN